MTKKHNFEPCWITSQDALTNAIDQWVGANYLILDTEFERTNTFFAKPGLIQVAHGEKIFLIDPLKVEDLTPLAQILESENIEIVLHSMSEDIDLLSYHCKCNITRVFDTQIAAAFLGYGMSLGYQRLVEEVLGEELEKSETRSDWLQRPLSDDQVYYAAEDVYFLQKIYLILKERLAGSPWTNAVAEEGAEQVRSIVEAYNQPEKAYMKLRGAWDLSLEDQRGLQQLVAWRDETAIKRNVPKSWVFSDAILIELMRRKPSQAKQLFRLDRIKPKSVKIYGDQVVEIIANLDKTVPEGFEAVPRPIKGRELDLYKLIKKAVTRVANTHNLEPQLIASRKIMESWVMRRLRDEQKGLPASTTAWRQDLLQDALPELA